MSNSSCTRVVPKNLFLSAQRALSEQTIRSAGVTHSNIRDLCTLITLSVLYDDVETLGSKAELSKDSKPNIAPEYEKIRDLTGLQIKVGPTPAEFDETLKESISFAIRPFARANKNITLSELKARLGESLRAETSDQPDYWEDFAEGQKLLQATNLNEFGTSPENFWLRSFLYAGLASTRKRPFVPDAIRSWGMHQTSSVGADYGQHLEQIIEAKYPPSRMWELIRDSPFPIPPFAATVFLRAGSTHRNIPTALRILREDMTPVRDALSSFQREKDTADYSGLVTIFGQSHTPDSKITNDDRVRNAIEALRKATVAVPPQILVLKPVFDMVKSVTSLVTNLVSPSPRIFGAFKDGLDVLSKKKDVTSRADTAAFVEVHHRLGWALRGWFNSGIRLEDMFGPIRDDEPSGIEP